MDTLLQELIAFLQNASPLVWSALMKQVYAVGVQKAVLSLFFVLVFFALLWLANRGTKMEKNDDEWEGLDWFAWLLSIMAAFIAVASASGAIMRFYNPEYYAIQMILTQLGQ